MIGNFRSVGITLKYHPYRNVWWAYAEWNDDGHAVDGSAWLKIGTSYALPIEQAIDTLMQDAEKLGLPFPRINDVGQWLFIKDEENPTAPDNWREILQEQAARLGWRTYG